MKQFTCIFDTAGQGRQLSYTRIRIRTQIRDGNMQLATGQMTAYYVTPLFLPPRHEVHN